MNLEDLSKFGIPDKYIEKFREENVKELYPPQIEVIKKGLFKEKNLVLSIPTAGGKTLIATVAILHKLLEKKDSKIVYIVPLVALASEKYQYFKKYFSEFKVAMSVGDYDSSDLWLADYDIICITTEKLDSLLRHNVQWVTKIGLTIVDEIHLLNDTTRGPTLEVLITKLKQITPRAQILGLSATISNADELAKWLNATLVISDFRPVKLYEGVYFDSKIIFEDKNGQEIPNEEDPENSIVDNTLSMNKQALIFTSTRKNAESLAERLGKAVKFKLKRGDSLQLQTLGDEIENVLEYPTQQCKKLAKCIKSGVAFHHAGLLSQQRKLIENKFRDGFIKTIVATPTLAMGVNLPAFRVIIRDAKRYYPGLGAMYIPVLEYKQFVGRAGRPQYDSYGESILIAKSEDEARDLIRHFINGQPEKITSKLAVEPILRMHTLALIASNFCNSEESLLHFFDKTFHAFQYNDISMIEEKVYEILEQFQEWRFIDRKKDSLVPTTIGKRVSELYIDPLTAFNFLTSLSRAPNSKLTEFSLLQILSDSIEMKPLFSVRLGDLAQLEKTILERESQFLVGIPEEYDLDFEDFIKSVNLALMFEEWINEATEDKILTKFKVAPGELRGRLENADWLVYSLQELALLQGQKEILSFIRKLRVRLQYGIKEELITLVKLKNIGRIRSRKLHNAGLTSIDKLKKIPIERLNALVGVSVAHDIKKQLGEKVAEIKKEKQRTLGNGVAGI